MSPHSSGSEPRFRVSMKVYLTWQDAQGAIRRCPAKCIDLSTSGACVETIDTLKPHSDVIVYSENFARMGHATVRYCSREVMKYRIGLQFSTALALGDAIRQQAVLRAAGPGQNHNSR
jgi:hypothetical protein